MPTLVDYRRRIRSVKNTQQITRAMKFVAAARLRRAQEKVFSARPYAREIRRVLRSAVARIGSLEHPLLERRAEKRVLLMVVSSDKGLCGPFNANLLRHTIEFLRQRDREQTQLIPVGKKGLDALRKRGWSFAAEYVKVSFQVEFRRAQEIAARVAELYRSRRADTVYAIYNEFKSVLIHRLRSERILPIDPEAFAVEQNEPKAGRAVEEATLGPPIGGDYIYEQPPEEIFSNLVPRYLEAEIFRILLESTAAEHAARMTAMDSATKNASDLIDSLTLQMNKTRQASITKELIEIISGAASATA